MDKLTDVEKIHYSLMLIMDEIDRICQENNITYSLTGGSMIGAVRHKGFIPWDDDMDIALVRSEYDRFIECCKTCLGMNFELITPEIDIDYPYSFAKIFIRGTKIVQYGFEDVSWNKGIYVDIFPLDNVPQSRLSRKIHKYRNYFYIKMLERKTSSYIVDNKNFIKRVGFGLMDIISQFVSTQLLKEKLLMNCCRYMDEDSEFVCNLGGLYGYDRETTYKNYFLSTIRVPFENRCYNIIKEYDRYLTNVYGNYMELPPVAKRHVHNFVELDFGNLFVDLQISNEKN